MSAPTIKEALLRSILFLVDKVRFRYCILAFFGTVLVFATFYYILTPFHHGVVFSGTEVPTGSTNVVQHLSPWNAMYFSVVTVSSLGYGDMHPVGYSKLLAGAEVLLGLAMMGIILAKLTSARLSYHVRRLFAADAQRRLDGYSAQFAELAQGIESVTTDVGHFFQETPSPAVPHSDQPVFENFRMAVSSFSERSESLHGYVAYEVQHGDFFADVPAEAITKLAEALENLVFAVGQLVASMTIRARTELFKTQERRLVRRGVLAQRELCSIVCAHATRRELVEAFNAVRENCDAIPESYFVAPEIPVEAEQPDQMIQESDEPADQ